MPKSRKGGKGTRKNKGSRSSIHGGALTPAQVTELTPAVLTSLDARYVPSASSLTMTASLAPTMKVATIKWKPVGDYKVYNYWEKFSDDALKYAGNTNGGDILIGNIEQTWSGLGPFNGATSNLIVSKKNMAGATTESQIGSLTPVSGKTFVFKLQKRDKSAGIIWRVDSITPTIGEKNPVGTHTFVTNGRDRKKDMFLDATTIGWGKPPPKNTLGPGTKAFEIYTLFVSPYAPTDVLPEGGVTLTPGFIVYRTDLVPPDIVAPNIYKLM